MKKSFLTIILFFPAAFLTAMDVQIASPVIEENIIIWPVISDEDFPTADYITLDEGIASGQVKIREIASPEGEEDLPEFPNLEGEAPAEQVFEVQQIVQGYGSGAQVNALQIENQSGRPLFIMAGEIIKGGKQNRVVQLDTIILSGSEALSLDVFCVERGRWQTDTETPEPEAFISDTSLVVQNSLRKTVVNVAEQSKVWEDVEEMNTAQAGTSRTGDYTSNFADPERMKRVDRIMNNLLPRLPANCVGAVAAIGGRIYGGDIIFDRHLFLSLQ